MQLAVVNAVTGHALVAEPGLPPPVCAGTTSELQV